MIFLRFLSKLNKELFLFKLRRKNKVILEGKLIIKLIPVIDVKNKSKIIIGKNVTLNSDNRGYHINMHSPVKIFADGDEATIRIGKNTRLNGVCIHAWKNISIGENCLIAANCHIMDSNGHELSFDNVSFRINTKDMPRDVIIEDNVWIGANTFVMPGVKIGAGSVIAANSVVVKSIPEMVIAGGNPAIIIKDMRSMTESKH